MMDWITHYGMQALGIGGYFVVGLFVFLGYFKRSTDDRRSEADKLADGLITRLQQTVDQQAKDMTALQEQMNKHTVQRDAEIKDLRGKVDHLTGRNGVLEDLFKGRDPAMQTFLKEAPTLITIARENNGLAKEMADGLGSLENTLMKFVDTLQPLLIHLELKKSQIVG